MNSKPEISVIVPAYNVEEYIGKCLKSLKNQTFKNFEVLVVDDGSTDNTYEMIKSSSENDERFRLMKCEHCGLSGVRNFALQNALGDYIAFVDSDDFVSEDYLGVLYKLCKENDAEISTCNFYYYFPKDDSSKVRIRKTGDRVLTSKDALKILLRDKKMQSYVWNKLFKRTLFFENDITFPSIYFEDLCTTPKLIYFSNRVASTSKALYYYTQREGSIMNMNKIQLDKVDDLITSVSRLNHFFCCQKCNDFRSDLKKNARKFFYASKYFAYEECKGKIKFRKTCEKLRMIDKNFKHIRRHPELVELPYRISDDN